MTPRLHMLSIAFIVLYALSLPSTAYSAADEKPLVVATTSVIGSVVRDLAGDRVDVYVVASPTVCPAHYDIRPGDVEAFKRAKLILYHGFEPWVKQLKEASGTRAPLVKVGGPWNTPDSLKELYKKVANALALYLHMDLNASLSRSLAAIDKVASELKEIAKEHGFSRVKVIVMKWQRPFIEWLGFEVVAEYPPPEKLSAKDIAELEKIGKEKGVQLVIDNLQSGTWFGEQLAERIGAVHVVLTNFPDMAPGLNNMTEVMKYNVKLLAKAVETYDTEVKVRSLESEVATYKYVAIALGIIAAFEAALLVLVRVRRK